MMGVGVVREVKWQENSDMLRLNDQMENTIIIKKVKIGDDLPVQTSRTVNSLGMSIIRGG